MQNRLRIASRPFTSSFCALALAAACAAGIAAQATRPPLQATLSQITWLVGNWRASEAGAIVEERWTTPAGGAMLAVARTLKGPQMAAFEFLRIVERNGTLIYIAQPGGRSPVEFTLSILTENSATFANPAHDFPKMIRYTQRDDGRLETIVGDGGANTETFVFERTQ